MCGIVGYVGFQDAASFLIDGLRKLEYRGYDSAGPKGMSLFPKRIRKSSRICWRIYMTVTFCRPCKKCWTWWTAPIRWR